MTQAVKLSQIGSPGVSTGFKNRVINGSMMIDQRNAGASVTPNNTYTLDRWAINNSQTSKLTVQQSSTAPTGFSNSLLVTSSSAYSIGANDYFVLQQRVEGFNFADAMYGTANAKTFTISFWVRSSLTGTFGGSFENSAFDYSYPFSYTISSANTWEQKSVTIAGATAGTWIGATNGIGLVVNFGLGVGSTYSGTAGSWAATNYNSATGATSVVGTNGATFYITGVQLEVGTTATDFEYIDYGRQLAQCQRYYQLLQGTNGSGESTTSITQSLAYKVEMRSSPTISQNAVARVSENGADKVQSSISIFANNASTRGALVTLGNFTGMTQYRPYFWNANTDWSITLSAEL